MKAKTSSKTPVAYRLEKEALSACKSASELSGRTQTKVIEDALLRRRILPTDIENYVRWIMTKEKKSFDEVITDCVQKVITLEAVPPDAQRKQPKSNR